MAMNVMINETRQCYDNTHVNFLSTFIFEQMSSTLKFVAKIGVCSTAVVYTVREGLWSSSQESQKAYKDFRSVVIPEFSNDYLRKVPSTEETHLALAGLWNSAVHNGFYHLRRFPFYVIDATTDLKESVVTHWSLSGYGDSSSKPAPSPGMVEDSGTVPHKLGK